MIKVSKNRIENVLVVTEEVVEKVNVLVNKIKPLQDVLNKALAKNDDYAKTLKVSSGKSINYGDCIASECDEIRNSTPWKHWKFTTELDKENLNLEIADIFHFAPSVELISDAHIPVTDILLGVDYNNLVNSIDDIKDTTTFMVGDKDIDIELNDLVNFITHTISGDAGILALFFSKLKYVGNISNSEFNILKTTNMEVMLLAIYIHQFVFNTTIEESIEMISNTYIAKNTLNSFRNSNGYNTGEYVKIWNGREDNMVAMDIMSKHPEYTPEELYMELIESYANAIR